MTEQRPMDDLQEELVDSVAREIQFRGLTTPVVLFLEASRPYRQLGGQAMLFFDPLLRGVFTGEVAGVDRVLAEEGGVERLIERLEELDDDLGWDA